MEGRRVFDRWMVGGTSDGGEKRQINRVSFFPPLLVYSHVLIKIHDVPEMVLNILSRTNRQDPHHLTSHTAADYITAPLLSGRTFKIQICPKCSCELCLDLSTTTERTSESPRSRQRERDVLKVSMLKHANNNNTNKMFQSGWPHISKYFMCDGGHNLWFPTGWRRCNSGHVKQ